MLTELMRSDFASLQPYEPIPPIEEIERRTGHAIVKLDANENPYGPAPAVHAALERCCAERYPDADCTELRRLLGRYLGLAPERIVCSAGGDEMLDLLLRLFLDPGDEVIDCTPSFVMYRLSTAYSRGTIVPVPRNPERAWAVDVEAIERAISPRTKIIIVCSPNNPTGNPTPEEDIVRLLDTGRMLVLDEAYAEFSGYTRVHLTASHPNLVVTRTMSKWAALAAIRLGYAALDPAVAEAIGRVKSPYNVGVAAQAAGIASLQHREYLMANVRRLIAERERLSRALAALPFGRVYPSETNFLFWTTDGLDADVLRLAMADRGVLVRAIRDPVQAIRVSIGQPDETDTFLRVLQESYAELTA
jgi:histidinol-phosphate aminotransferase